MNTMINPDNMGFLLNDIARQSRAIFEREIDAAHLTVTAAEARVLAHMTRAGATRQHLLAESLGMTPMGLTGFLDRLEAAGLVRRDGDPDDRRAKIVTLTAGASDILSRIAQAGARAEFIMSQQLSPEDWSAFRDIAKRLRSSLVSAQATLDKSGDAP